MDRCLQLREVSPGLLSSAHYLPVQFHLQCLSRFHPLVLFAIRLYDSNLSQAQRSYSLCSPPRANPPDFRGVHEYPPTWFRNEGHRTEDWSVLAVLQLGPYPFLRLSCHMECLRRRAVDGPACKGANETGSEEDGKDPEVLGGVVYGNTFVTRTEGVLDERAEVMRQWHVQ